MKVAIIGYGVIGKLVHKKMEEKGIDDIIPIDKNREDTPCHHQGNKTGQRYANA